MNPRHEGARLESNTKPLALWRTIRHGSLSFRNDRRVALALAHVSSSLRAKLDQHGVSKVVGAGLIFDTLRECLGAFHARGALTGFSS